MKPVIWALAALSLSASALADDELAEKIARGAYLTRIAACSDCHTPGNFSPAPDLSRELAGATTGFFMPGLGYFWGPNLTPDPETGLGKWSEEQIVTLLRTGVRPDGRVIAPFMPVPAYAQLTDSDAAAIAAYLKSLKPIVYQVPAPQGPDAEPAGPFQAVVAPDGKIIR